MDLLKYEKSMSASLTPTALAMGTAGNIEKQAICKTNNKTNYIALKRLESLFVIEEAIFLRYMAHVSFSTAI
jgi:hypothetical protein